MEDSLNNEIFVKALSLMRYFSNTAAESMAYHKSWGDEFTIKNVKNSFEYVSEHDNYDIDFWKEVFKLPSKLKGVLGFCFFDEETREQDKMLIPLWIVESLPKDFDVEVTSITGENCSIKNINKDIRFGCVAYLI